MRITEILTEAAIIDISHTGSSGNYRFDVTMDHGAMLRVFTELHADGSLEIVDIWTEANGHPDTFKASTKSGSENYQKGVKLGPALTRSLLQHIIRVVKQDGPVTSLTGARMTGSRAFARNKDTRVGISGT